MDGLSFHNTLNIVDELLERNQEANDAYLRYALLKMDLDVKKKDILNFDWDRDAKYTLKLVVELKEFLRQNYKKAKKENKKFIVVSHSWGTVLSYLALSYSSQETEPIFCDLFITLSSPLGTEYIPIPPRCAIEKIISNEIQNFVSTFFILLNYRDCNNCYPSVSKWINYYAYGDLISGPINYTSNIVNLKVDAQDNSTCSNRSKKSTDIWHLYTSLQENSIVDNTQLIEQVQYDICSIIDCPSTNNETITLGFILDSSGSMTQNDPNDMRKSAMKVIVDQLQGNENIFIIDFDDRAKWINSTNWQNIDKQNLKSSIININSDGGTNIGKGLEELKSAFESLNITGKAGVLLLSDGLGDYSNQAEWFSQRNIPIYTISFIGEDNSKLLSEIASSTSGNYLKANSDTEIITAFNQFINFLQGNAILTVYKNNISQGENLSSSFFTDADLRCLFVTLIWQGSKIDLELNAPDGKVYTSSSQECEWNDGDNYVFVKINNPTSGKWTANLVGVQIPIGGENFNFQVSGDSPLKIDLNEKKSISNQLQFELQNTGVGSISKINTRIEVTTPHNRKEDISKNFSNHAFSYRPIDGKGNYNFEISLSAKDNNGSQIQRYFARTVLIGDGIPINMAEVKKMEGNFLYADLGQNIGNYQGLECVIYSQSGKLAIANGYVTTVNETECLIEIISFINDQTVNVGDIVELNVAQWRQDY